MRIFISHSTTNVAVAESLKNKLSILGASVWLAKDDIPPGSNFAEEVTNAIESTDCLVVILSEDSLHSPHVKREVNLAIDKKKKVIPVALGAPSEYVNLLPEDWKYWLTVIQLLEFKSADETAARILESVKNSTGTALKFRRNQSRSSNRTLYIMLAILITGVFFSIFQSQQTTNNTFDEGIIAVSPETKNYVNKYDDELPLITQAVVGFKLSDTFEGSFPIKMNSTDWITPPYWQINGTLNACSPLFWIMQWRFSDSEDEAEVVFVDLIAGEGTRISKIKTGNSGYLSAYGCMAPGFKLKSKKQESTIWYSLQIWEEDRNI